MLILGLGLIQGCGDDEGVGGDDDNGDDSFDPIYRQRMRDFVQGISAYSKGIDANFIIIPQNGQELVTADGEGNGPPVTQYLAAIDGVGREDLFYGYDNDDVATPGQETSYMIDFLDVAEDNGVEVLVADYCWTHSKMNDSYTQNAAHGYISFAADHRELDNIPDYPTTPYGVNTDNISTLAEAKNFLYLIDPSGFPSRTNFLSAVRATNYDVILIDLFYDDTALNPLDVASLKTKQSGQSRLVIAYMSIGEAEDYRYYWQSEWETSPPSWLMEENPDWPGNYKVRYWDAEWQAIIFGNNGSYLKMIIDAGFDGVYLDLIDAFEYFE
jgi:cysteinyl-tRNA synthetase